MIHRQPKSRTARVPFERWTLFTFFWTARQVLLHRESFTPSKYSGFHCTHDRGRAWGETKWEAARAASETTASRRTKRLK